MYKKNLLSKFKIFGKIFPGNKVLIKLGKQGNYYEMTYF